MIKFRANHEHQAFLTVGSAETEQMHNIIKYYTLEHFFWSTKLLKKLLLVRFSFCATLLLHHLSSLGFNTIFSLFYVIRLAIININPSVIRINLPNWQRLLIITQCLMSETYHRVSRLKQNIRNRVSRLKPHWHTSMKSQFLPIRGTSVWAPLQK